MTPSISGRSLTQLTLCLLLIGNLLVWSASWNAPAFHGGQFEQLGDGSPPFLPGTGEGFAGDDAAAMPGHGWPAVGWLSTPVMFALAMTVSARIRISHYPVLPQAPPLNT
ncbi:MAG: hypothetical protein RJQ10_04185 [Haliea sp.]|uniref:hypothetical protein n=1 Tax=Haliea sp. TaxID=1932666 RepID=UPI0032ED5998